MNRIIDRIVLTEIIDVQEIFSPKGRFVQMHDRKSYGLTFCREGQITYTQRGKRFVSDRAHALILPQGGNYTLYGDRTGTFPVINFRCLDVLSDVILAIPVWDPESYLGECEQMRSLFLFGNNHAKRMSILYTMLHRLAFGSSPESHLLAPAMEYLQAHYMDPALTNATLAGLCSISEVYFRKLFAKCYQTTPKQFVIDARIGRAKRLLADGALKVNAVAEQCGFSSPYSFCRVFKQKAGMTPGEYMKQNRIYKI